MRLCLHPAFCHLGWRTRRYKGWSSSHLPAALMGAGGSRGRSAVINTAIIKLALRWFVLMVLGMEHFLWFLFSCMTAPRQP